MSDTPKNKSLSNSKDSNRITKSELFHIWKKARVMYEYVKEDTELEDWVRKNITQAYELIDQAVKYSEYEKMFPRSEEKDDGEGENNFLSNQDKRYPVPTAQESGDQFITRCILDANMKTRYPIQGDRFSACMSIFNSKKDETSSDLHSNPGEKFEDPMSKNDQDLGEPIKPILP